MFFLDRVRGETLYLLFSYKEYSLLYPAKNKGFIIQISLKKFYFYHKKKSRFYQNTEAELLLKFAYFMKFV